MSCKFVATLLSVNVASHCGAFDNALAEAANGPHKTELIRRKDPWRTFEQIELATLEYAGWWINSRLHGKLHYRTPVEVEAGYYAGPESPPPRQERNPG